MKQFGEAFEEAIKHAPEHHREQMKALKPNFRWFWDKSQVALLTWVHDSIIDPMGEKAKSLRSARDKECLHQAGAIEECLDMVQESLYQLRKEYL